TLKPRGTAARVQGMRPARNDHAIPAAFFKGRRESKNKAGFSARLWSSPCQNGSESFLVLVLRFGILGIMGIVLPFTGIVLPFSLGPFRRKRFNFCRLIIALRIVNVSILVLRLGLSPTRFALSGLPRWDRPCRLFYGRTRIGPHHRF